MAVLYCVRGLGEAHMNPAITLAMLATRRTSVIRAALFIACQFVGGILGAAFVRAITSGDERNANGCTKIAGHVNEGQLIVLYTSSQFNSICLFSNNIHYKYSVITIHRFEKWQPKAYRALK